MPKNTTTHSGTIRRIFVDASTSLTRARFTLLGHNTVHHVSMLTDLEDPVRRALELTSPGDEVSFECETTGWLFKQSTLRRFENVTLDNELSN